MTVWVSDVWHLEVSN